MGGYSNVLPDLILQYLPVHTLMRLLNDVTEENFTSLTRTASIFGRPNYLKVRYPPGTTNCTSVSKVFSHTAAFTNQNIIICVTHKPPKREFTTGYLNLLDKRKRDKKGEKYREETPRRNGKVRG